MSPLNRRSPASARVATLAPGGRDRCVGRRASRPCGFAAEQATRLQAALRVRELIAQAQGVVMARHGVSAEAASATLLRSARQAHISLRRQATEITASTQRQVPLTGGEP